MPRLFCTIAMMTYTLIDGVTTVGTVLVRTYLLYIPKRDRYLSTVRSESAISIRGSATLISFLLVYGRYRYLPQVPTGRYPILQSIKNKLNFAEMGESLGELSNRTWHGRTSHGLQFNLTLHFEREGGVRGHGSILYRYLPIALSCCFPIKRDSFRRFWIFFAICIRFRYLVSKKNILCYKRPISVLKILFPVIEETQIK